MNPNEFQKSLLKILGLPEKQSPKTNSANRPHIFSEVGAVGFDYPIAQQLAAHQKENDESELEIPVPSLDNLYFAEDEQKQLLNFVRCDSEKLLDKERVLHYRHAEVQKSYTPTQYHLEQKKKIEKEIADGEYEGLAEKGGIEYQNWGHYFEVMKRREVARYGYFKNESLWWDIENVTTPEYMPERPLLYVNNLSRLEIDLPHPKAPQFLKDEYAALGNHFSNGYLSSKEQYNLVESETGEVLIFTFDFNGFLTILYRENTLYFRVADCRFMLSPEKSAT